MRRPTKGMRKLTDVASDLREFRRLISELLEDKHVRYITREHAGYTRFWVEQKDLCCATTILMAAQRLIEGGLIR